MFSAAELFARAGYLKDAAEIAAKVGIPPEQFVRARTLYGDLVGARRVIDAVRDPDQRVILLTAVGNILWRMRDPANAKKILAEAEGVSKAIPNIARRKARMQVVLQLRDVLADEPPIPLSHEPSPQPRAPASSPVPAFPITVDGFRQKDPKATTDDAQENGVYLTRLYALAAAGDHEGLLNHTRAASTPFQKAMGLASLEHILIQLRAPAEAEKYAREIPNDCPDCTLARVEALSAVATAWARTGDPERAQKCFEEALVGLKTVGLDLAFGKAVVAASIAAAQYESGLVATSAQTFELALKLTSQVPSRPKPVKGVYPKMYFSRGFQDDAFRAIFAVAIRIYDGAARRTAEMWHDLAGDEAYSSIVDAWLAAGRKEDALAFARTISDPEQRVAALLWLARSLLDDAGAPVI
jgi:tetratricopeptide (TPR) repeat protein